MDRAGPQGFAQAEFLPGMGAEGVVQGELFGHLPGQGRIEAPLPVDLGELGQFAGGIHQQLAPFPGQIGRLGVELGFHRHVFLGRHRHGPGHGGSQPRQQDEVAGRAGGGEADHQGRHGNGAEVGAQHHRPQPASPLAAVLFVVMVVLHDLGAGG